MCVCSRIRRSSTLEIGRSSGKVNSPRTMLRSDGSVGFSFMNATMSLNVT